MIDPVLNSPEGFNRFHFANEALMGRDEMCMNYITACGRSMAMDAFLGDGDQRGDVTEDDMVCVSFQVPEGLVDVHAQRALPYWKLL